MALSEGGLCSRLRGAGISRVRGVNVADGYAMCCITSCLRLYLIYGKTK